MICRRGFATRMPTWRGLPGCTEEGLNFRTEDFRGNHGRIVATGRCRQLDMATANADDVSNERPSAPPSAFDFVKRSDLTREERANIEFIEAFVEGSVEAVRPHGWTGGSRGSGVDQKTPTSTFAARGRFESALREVFGRPVLFMSPQALNFAPPPQRYRTSSIPA